MPEANPGAKAMTAVIVEIPGLPEKGDVYDAIASGMTKDYLVALADAAFSETPTESRSPFTWLNGPTLDAYRGEQQEEVTGPWVLRGGLTGLSGPPKEGKTHFTLAMCAAVTFGRPFLGYPVQQGAVLYMTEEAPTTFRIAAARHGLLSCADFHVLSHRLTVADWPETMVEVASMVTKVAARLVVCDTYYDWTACEGEQENQAGAHNAFMAPLLALTAAESRPGLLCNFHERKSSGDVVDAIRGSSAIAGKLDMVLSLRQAPGGTNRRTLSAKGRWDAPESVTIEWDGSLYRLLGSGSAPLVGSIKDEVLDVLPAGAENAIRFEKELLPLLRERGFKSRSSVQRAVEQLVAEGVVGQEKRPVGRAQPRYVWRMDEDEMTLDV